MQAVLELFKEEGTVDELGIGSIRDAIADILFPGTSVLHTRARYLLFVPWILQHTVCSGSSDGNAERLRAAEVKLIHSLLQGGEFSGVIGAQARDKLKRMPSAAYWAALGTFEIRAWNATLDGHLRAASAQHRTAENLEGDSLDGSLVSNAGFHGDLPAPPHDLLKGTTFDLDAEEASFLRDRMIASRPESLLAWLVARDVQPQVERIWHHPLLDAFPAALGNAVDQGRRLSVAIHGAAVIYNLMLAEKLEASDLVDEYRLLYEQWVEELEEERPFDGWSVHDLWSLIFQSGRSLKAPTMSFVERWVALAASGLSPADKQARSLIRDRELALKGGRARLVNPAALTSWRGASGLVRLDYRWAVALRFLTDIDAAHNVEEVA